MKNEYIIIYDSRSYSDFCICTKIEFFDTFKDALKELRNLKRESKNRQNLSKIFKEFLKR